MDTSADTTCARGRIEGSGNSGLGFGPAIHHGHNDAVRAVVQYALDMVMTVRGNAGKCCAPPIRDRAEHMRRGLPVHEAMLDVHREPRKSGPRHEPRGRDTAE